MYCGTGLRNLANRDVTRESGHVAILATTEGNYTTLQIKQKAMASVGSVLKVFEINV